MMGEAGVEPQTKKVERRGIGMRRSLKEVRPWWDRWIGRTPSCQLQKPRKKYDLDSRS